MAVKRVRLSKLLRRWNSPCWSRSSSSNRCCSGVTGSAIGRAWVTDRLVNREVRASAACGRSVSPFNMSRHFFRTGQHERRRFHPEQDQTVEAIETPVTPDPAAVAAGPNRSLPASDSSDRLQQLEQELQTLKSEHETLQSVHAHRSGFRQLPQGREPHQTIYASSWLLDPERDPPVVDNFERARQQLNPEGEEAQALHRSYQVHKTVGGGAQTAGCRADGGRGSGV